MTLELNPRDLDDQFLKHLNYCFGHWGDRRKYDWYFRRKTPFPPADLMVLKKDGETAAGSAVTYRNIALPNEGQIMVGIMTGSWTLPPFRNQGCFARIIDESLRLTRIKGGALLLGFAVDDRPSFRQLARAGSALFPSSYIFSTPQTRCPASTIRQSVVNKSEAVPKLCAGLRAGGQGYARFIYHTEDEFDSQFIRRTGETEILEDEHGNHGVIERADDTDILQLYLAPSGDERCIEESLAGFLKRSLMRERKLFLYSTHQAVAALAGKLGFEIKRGFITALIADEARLRDALELPSGAAIDSTSRLAEAGSDWFLGRWNVQSGDRA